MIKCYINNKEYYIPQNKEEDKKIRNKKIPGSLEIKPYKQWMKKVLAHPDWVHVLLI